MPAHQHVWRNFQIQQVIFEAAVTLADLEHVPQVTPGPEHGVDVGAFDGAAEAIPELLHVGHLLLGGRWSCIASAHASARGSSFRSL